jgi:hypothetical protein
VRTSPESLWSGSGDGYPYFNGAGAYLYPSGGCQQLEIGGGDRGWDQVEAQDNPEPAGSERI